MVLGVVSGFRCFQRDGRQRHASLVVPLLLLPFCSRFGITLAMRACSFEPSLSVALHVSQRDLEVVKPELRAGLFFLGFLLALSRVSPSGGANCFFISAISCVRSMVDITCLLRSYEL